MSICRTSSRLLPHLLRVALPKTDSRGIKRWVAPTLRELQARKEKLGPRPPEPRSAFLEWNYDAEIYAFGKRLGEDFEEGALRRALTNRSYCNKIKDENQEDLADNVELIEEGERFIRNCVREEYGGKYPDVIVDSLLKYFLSEKLLGHVGFYIGLKDIVLTAEFPVEEATLANSLKAVIAALLRSSGEDRAKLFVEDFLFAKLVDKDVFEVWNPERPLEYLESVLKEKGIEGIEPRLCNQSAVNTILANYQVGLYNNRKLLGIGWGENIEVAKETAALDALKRLYK